MIATGSLALLLVLAQTTTIFNTTIVRVDRAARTITVGVDAGADGGADRTRTRQLVVAPSAAASLATLKAGAKVLLTLRGDTVVDIKLSAGSGGGGSSTPYSGGRRPPGASSPTHRGVPQLPASADPPQGRPVPQVAPAGGRVITVSPSPLVSPAGVAPTRPAVSPVAVSSPRSPGTPKPVVLPSDPPPTPIP